MFYQANPYHQNPPRGRRRPARANTNVSFGPNWRRRRGRGGWGFPIAYPTIAPVCIERDPYTLVCLRTAVGYNYGYNYGAYGYPALAPFSGYRGFPAWL